MIPICDPKQQYLQLKEPIDVAMQQVAATGQYILGPNVAALEQSVSEYCGVAHAIGVNSGTDALHLALRALDIGPDDEVITAPFTFIATTEAIGIVGATPVFVDVDPVSLNIDPNQIEGAITARTKAILPVHLYGQPCDMAAIVDIASRHGLRVVEDCAQSLGATCDGRRVGGIGDIGCVSFFPTKNLGCLGDGGMVVTNDAQLAQRVETLRRHGARVKYHHDELGLNSRLDELQAAVLRVKLPQLDQWNLQRREKARIYDELLSNVAGVTIPTEVTPAAPPALGHIYHQYTVRLDRRDNVQTAMHARGVQCVAYYPKCLHQQTVHADLPYGVGSFPVAEHAARTCLSLPMYPELDTDAQCYVAESLARCVAQFAVRQAG